MSRIVIVLKDKLDSGVTVWDTVCVTYDIHVDGVRLRLWTAAASWHIVHSPGDDHGEP
jgi:hypothetical protein